MDACIPALHLDLGIFPYLYAALLADARDLDIKLAKLIDNVDDSGTEFRKLVKIVMTSQKQKKHYDSLRHHSLQ